MDQQEQNIPQELPEIPVSGEESRYQPRPKWQVWGARIGVAVFLVMVIMSAILMARGGSQCGS